MEIGLKYGNTRLIFRVRATRTQEGQHLSKRGEQEQDVPTLTAPSPSMSAPVQSDVQPKSESRRSTSDTSTVPLPLMSSGHPIGLPSQSKPSAHIAQPHRWRWGCNCTPVRPGSRRFHRHRKRHRHRCRHHDASSAAISPAAEIAAGGEDTELLSMFAAAL